MIPMPSDTTTAPVEEGLNRSWASRLDLETDVAYSLHLVAPSGAEYQGSLKTIVEDSTNTAGTRRFLMKVEVPLASPNPAEGSNSGCCCQASPDDGSIPSVSAHIVLTVPKTIAQALAKGDSQSRDRVAAAVRILQTALSSVATAPVELVEGVTPAGTVIAENLVLKTMGEHVDPVTGILSFPVTYEQTTGKVRINTGLKDDAPIWGLIGGLRPLA
jgi:hypothetical protein